MQLQISKKTR